MSSIETLVNNVNRYKRQLAFAGCGLVGFGVLLSLRSSQSGDKSKPVQAYYAHSEVVKVGDIQDTGRYPGQCVFPSFSKIGIFERRQRFVKAVYCESGNFVYEGDLVFELNNDVESATVETAKAKLLIYKDKFERNQALFDQSAISEVELLNAENEYKVGLAELERAEAELELTCLFAPFDGYLGVMPAEITEGHMYDGATIDIINPDVVHVRFRVPVSIEYDRENPDLAVLINNDLCKGAHLLARGVSVDHTQTVDFVAQIDNLSEDEIQSIAMNQYALVTMALAKVEDTLILPSSCVQQHGSSDNGKVLKVIEVDNSLLALEVPVKIGINTVSTVEIVGGLHAGDKVLLDGSASVQGETVVLVNEAESNETDTVAPVQSVSWLKKALYLVLAVSTICIAWVRVKK